MSFKDDWLIKDTTGKVRGPYNRETIFSLIDKAALTGVELIAEYPSGDYTSISQVAAFYDRFLDVWESEVKSLTKEEKNSALDEAQELSQARKSVDSGKSKGDKPVDESSVGASQSGTDQSLSRFDRKISDSDAESISFVDDVSKLSGDTNTYNPLDDSQYGNVSKQGSFHRGDSEEEAFGNTKSGEPTQSGVYSDKRKVHERIDDRRPRRRNFNDLRVKFLVIFIAIMIGLLLYDDHPAEKIRDAKQIQLKAIKLKKKTEKISKKNLFKLKKNALQNIEKDSFPFYMKAMNDLVAATADHGPDSEILGLLCTTYRELWKYAKRNSSDIAAVSKATQIVSRMDVGGVSTSLCRAVQFLIAGNLVSAEQVADSALASFPRTASFFDIKAEINYVKGNHEIAKSYYLKTSELWPTWNKPRFWYANLVKLKGNYEEAIRVYLGILQNDFHELAAIELSEIYVFQKSNPEEAGELLDRAVSSQVKIPRVWESKAFYILSVRASQEGNTEQAIAYAKNSYELDTSNAVARSYLVSLAGSEILSTLHKTEVELVDNGELFFKKGNFLGAQAEYKAAFELNNKNAIAGLMAADSLWKLNQGDEAIRWLNNVVKFNSDNLDVRLLLAKYQVERFDFSAALINLKRARSLSKRDFRILRGFAHFEFARNNLKGAKKFSEQAIQLYDADLESHIILSKALERMRNLDGAYKIIARAIGLEPANVDAQTVYAEVLAQFQSMDTGIKYINNLINTYPGEMEFRLSLARMYMMDQKWGLAISVLKPITEVRSEYKPAFLLLAKAYIGEQDPVGALSAYLGAASLDPTDAHPLVEIGRMYLATKEPGKAVRQFERAKKLNPKYPRLNYNLGLAYLQFNLPKKALEAAKIEKRQNPMIADSYLLAADAYRILKRYNDAIAEYQQAVQRRPQSAEIYVKLGICYRLIGNLDIAEQMLATARSKESGYPEIYKETGAILEKKGRVLEAIDAYRQYLGLKPNAKDGDIVRLRIQELGG